jgi:MFS family permease
VRPRSFGGGGGMAIDYARRPYTPAPMGARRARGALLIVLLAPLAAVVGTWLASRDTKIALGVANRDVVRTLRAVAAANGVDASEWRVLVDVKPDNALRHYLETTATPAERAAAERILSPVVFRGVLENRKNAADSIHIAVSPRDGRLISWFVPPASAPKNVHEADARRAAEAELQRRLGPDRAGFTYSATGAQRHESTGSEIRRFSFRREFSKDLSAEARVDLSGGKVVGFTLTPSVAPSHTRSFLALDANYTIVRVTLIAVLILVAIVYVFARFVRRLREQEIPLKRAAIVAVFVFFAFAFSSLLGGQTQRIDAISRGPVQPAGIDYVGIVVVAAVMAFLSGVTWGACEADVREWYPEKLTSTDALLGGFFSARSVRSSLIVALTVAGWFILLSGLEPFVRERLGVWMAINAGENIVYQSAYPALLVLLFSFSNLPVLTGLLMAAVSATHRRGPTRGGKIALTALALFFFLLSSIGNHEPAAWGVVQGVIGAAALLVPFLVGDVLAVLVVSCVMTWAALAAAMAAQIAPSHRSAGTLMLALLALMIAGATIAAFRRRKDAEETAAEVEAARPEYARNMAERLMLRGEMEAARTAQERVMPRVVPSVEGVALAAKHSGANEIGTDYSEFFPAAGHLSVAVADARLPGLSSALCISMLKGLLLNYSARIANPRDVADRVYRQLSSIFGDDLPLSFFFGRLDRATGDFLFASFGDIPRAVLVRDGEATSLEGEEYVRLGPRASLVIYTADVPQLRDRDGAPLTDAALRDTLAATKSTDPQALLDSLAEMAARHARGNTEPQSWTAVAMAIGEGPR